MIQHLSSSTRIFCYTFLATLILLPATLRAETISYHASIGSWVTKAEAEARRDAVLERYASKHYQTTIKKIAEGGPAEFYVYIGPFDSKKPADSLCGEIERDFKEGGYFCIASRIW